MTQMHCIILTIINYSASRDAPSIYSYKSFNFENTSGEVFFSCKIGFIMFSYFKEKLKRYLYSSTFQSTCTQTGVHGRKMYLYSYLYSYIWDVLVLVLKYIELYSAPTLVAGDYLPPLFPSYL